MSNLDPTRQRKMQERKRREREEREAEKAKPSVVTKKELSSAYQEFSDMYEVNLQTCQKSI